MDFQKRYMENGDFYVNITTEDENIKYIFPDYEGALWFCKKKNIDIINIRKYCGYTFPLTQKKFNLIKNKKKT